MKKFKDIKKIVIVVAAIIIVISVGVLAFVGLNKQPKNPKE